MKISDSLTEKLLVVASKISNQKHMYAIKTTAAIVKKFKVA